MEQDLARLAGRLGVAAGEYDVGALLDELPRVLRAPPHRRPPRLTSRPSQPAPALQLVADPLRPSKPGARQASRQPGGAGGQARRLPAERHHAARGRAAVFASPDDDQGKGGGKARCPVSGKAHLGLCQEVMEVAQEVGGQALQRVVARNENDAVLLALALHRRLPRRRRGSGGQRRWQAARGRGCSCQRFH